MSEIQILVVEDDSIIAMDIENSLKRLGFAVTAKVSSGRKAIKKVEAHNPDLILMDIELKGEMDGIETALHADSKHGAASAGIGP